MRILQVTSYFSPHLGGIESHVKELSYRLSEEGHDVTVLTTNIPRTKREDKIGRVKILRYEGPLRPMGNPMAIGMLKGLLSKRDFDVVHCHDEHAFTSNLAALADYLGGRHLVVSCHGRLVYTAPFRRAVLRIYEKTLMLATLRTAQAVICLAESDRSYLGGLGVTPERIHVIPNAINLPRETESVKKRSDQKTILCVSQLLQRKGLDILIDAMQVVRGDAQEAKLLIIGEGERRTQLEMRCRKSDLEETVIFKGRASEHELEDAYRDCDVFVLPSLAEGVPTVILEAMARERPVIATDIPSIRDYFSQKAILVSPGDPHELSQAILRVLNDEQLQRRLGHEGRKLVERRFTWDIVARQIIDLYERILSC